jgi:ABC-type lipoprotein release transport system permease subunit
MYLTPAFYRLLPHALPSFPDPWVGRLKQGEADLKAFGEALARSAQIDAPPESLLDFLGRRGANANVRRSFHLQALALWLLAALTGAAFILIFGQLFARQVFLDSFEHNRLHALGMESRQLWGVSVLRATMTGVGGAVVAVVVALALSPLTPTGLARIAEPAPGFAVDAWAVGLGAAAVLLASVVFTAVPARRIFADVRLGQDEGAAGLSRSAESLARVGASAATVTGLRMAFERGGGATAVPVRTAITGVSIGLATLVAALTFGASLRHLGRNEHLYGVTWDMAIAQDGAAFATIGHRMLELPEVRGVAAAATGLGFLVDDVLAGETFALDPVAGSTIPAFPLLEGRAPAPATVPEIALGTRLMKRLGVQVGDVVRVVSSELKAPTRMKVVGRAVLPGTSEAARSGEGAWVSRRGLLDRGLAAEGEEAQLKRSNYAFLALRPGLSEAGKADLFQRIGTLYGFKLEDELYRPPFAKTSELANFGRVERMPEVLAGILAMIAAAALVHVLVTAVQRRKRDLAVLKTLGFVRRQVRGAVAVQATALVAVALAVGVPIGVVAGRATWNAFATDLGVIPEAVVPLGAVLVAVPAAFVLANLVAALPARSAARTQPALILRSE